MVRAVGPLIWGLLAAPVEGRSYEDTDPWGSKQPPRFCMRNTVVLIHALIHLLGRFSVEFQNPLIQPFDIPCQGIIAIAGHSRHSKPEQ